VYCDPNSDQIQHCISFGQDYDCSWNIQCKICGLTTQTETSEAKAAGVWNARTAPVEKPLPVRSAEEWARIFFTIKDRLPEKISFIEGNRVIVDFVKSIQQDAIQSRACSAPKKEGSIRSNQGDERIPKIIWRS
jgi:hypothetical protein